MTLIPGITYGALVEWQEVAVPGQAPQFRGLASILLPQGKMSSGPDRHNHLKLVTLIGSIPGISQEPPEKTGG